jgi:hypothetical protein
VATTSPLDETFEQLLAIDERAFAAGQHQTAYHALATALHRAIDLGSAPLLDRVRIRAHDHLQQLDESSSLHTVSHLYSGLVQLAANHAHILRARVEQRARFSGGGGDRSP